MESIGSSLVVQLLELHAFPLQVAWVWFLVGELISHKMNGTPKEKKKNGMDYIQKY